MSAAWTDLAWADWLGRLRVVSVPAEGPPARIEVDPADAGWEGLAGPLTLAPDPEAVFRSPWDDQREVVLCDLLGPDGNPSPACGRSLLKRVIASAADDGLDVVAAAELEFFLVDPSTGGPVYEAIENYGIVAGAAFEPVMREVRRLRHVGVPVVATNPEYGGGQFEINLRHEGALAAADAVVLLRAWTAVAAVRAGLACTFSAKPWPDGSGNGMHVHQSLWRGQTNAFFADGELSADGSAYLAGLLEHMGGLAPLGSPSAAAYRRRADRSFCPTRACWGGDNRTVAVRVLVEDEPTTRVEQRDAAADASPYLVFAGQFAAGLDGMRRGLEPPPATVGNAYHDAVAPELPRALAEALPVFAASTLARDLLGESAHELLVARLRIEAERDLAGIAAQNDPDGGW